ncbi:hypothetical protein DFH08DRAFT_950811 [Mycena albidolilacea]|uniref:Uncharacterized protein n=1 Tax=Mycena albidolilacea TaxID=1033008 RepID=A0AAD7F135_9AGAR|nr:hypothetical protein DFH08DRAFT_950811 [Mycena albidolilacea]
MFSAQFFVLVATAFGTLGAVVYDNAVESRSPALSSNIDACSIGSGEGCVYVPFTDHQCTNLPSPKTMSAVGIPPNWVCRFFAGINCKTNDEPTVYYLAPGEDDVGCFNDKASSFRCFHYIEG